MKYRFVIIKNSISLTNIEEAQRALVEFMYAMQSPFKPPRLTEQEFPIGDVAFGEEKEGIFFVLFTQDNGMVIIEAPTVVAKELAQKVDSIVLNSPAWTTGNPKPHLIITVEFLEAFFISTL